jgi:hypothetical protein
MQKSSRYSRRLAIESLEQRITLSVTQSFSVATGSSTITFDEGHFVSSEQLLDQYKPAGVRFRSALSTFKSPAGQHIEEVEDGNPHSGEYSIEVDVNPFYVLFAEPVQSFGAYVAADVGETITLTAYDAQLNALGSIAVAGQDYFIEPDGPSVRNWLFAGFTASDAVATVEIRGADDVDDISFKKAPDLVAKSIDWNTNIGGFDFTYAVQGHLLQPASAKVYWAHGPTYEDKIGDNPVFEHEITAGDRGGKPKQYDVHVDGSRLRGAPPQTTHIIVVFDADEELGEAKENNNVLKLADVKINYGGNPRAMPLTSDYSIGIIKDALRFAGQATAVILSTYRTPQQQADEMLSIINGPNGIREAERLYTKPAGVRVLQVYKSAESGYRADLLQYQFDLLAYQLFPVGPPPMPPSVPNYRSLMAAEIGRIAAANPDGGFAHTRDFSRWNTVDIQAATIHNHRLFKQAIQDPRINHRIVPPKDRAFHLEIRL